MTSSSTVREWWDGYQHATDRYVRVEFPGEGGTTWALLVADRSAPVWEAVADIMATTPYLFRESAGGTYSEREPGSTSLHTYALALDLNPKANPMQPPPLVYDYPPGFIDRVEGIRANGKQAVYWGGRWPASNPPDTMHWQINVAPEDCRDVTWDQLEDDMAGPAEWTDDDVARFEAIVNNMLVKNTDKNLAWHLRHGIATTDPATVYATAAEGPDGDS
jgi:hypothetical protein